MIKGLPPPSRKRRGCVRLFIILLLPFSLIVCLATLVLVSPGTVFQVFNFDSRGDIDTFWLEIESQTTEEPIALPPILQRLPTSVSVVGTVAPSPVPPTMFIPTEPATEIAIEVVTQAPTVSATVTPMPTFDYGLWFSSAEIPNAVRVTADGYMNLAFDRSGLFANTFLIGQSVSGVPLAIIEFEETAVAQLCEVYFNNCRSELYRIDTVDFRPRGLNIYGSINLGFWWQQIGAALVLNADNRTLRLGGVIINGITYAPPTSGRLAETIQSLVTRGNAALNAMNIHANNYTLRFAEMWFDNSRFVAVMQ